MFPTGKGKFQRLYPSGNCLLSLSVPSCGALKILVNNSKSSNLVLKTDLSKETQETAWTLLWKVDVLPIPCTCIFFILLADLITVVSNA